MTGANLHWAELEKMYETFVCTQSGKVELALKQLYTYLADGVINQEKKNIIYIDFQINSHPLESRRHKISFLRSFVLLQEKFRKLKLSNDEYLDFSCINKQVYTHKLEDNRFFKIVFTLRLKVNLKTAILYPVSG